VSKHDIDIDNEIIEFIRTVREPVLVSKVVGDLAILGARPVRDALFE
jgi:hypothetical protein